jgi:hypothetical protein
LVPSLPRLLLGNNGRRNSARANDREKGTLNGVIHPQPAKRDATRLSRAVLSTAPARAITERARQNPRHPAAQQATLAKRPTLN